VRVVVSGKAGDNTLTLDGQVSEALRDGDEVTVEGFGRKLLLLVSREKSYFQLLREKLHWGGRTLHG
jgi:NAD+ kinase